MGRKFETALHQKSVAWIKVHEKISLIIKGMQT